MEIFISNILRNFIIFISSDTFISILTDAAIILVYLKVARIIYKAKSEKKIKKYSLITLGITAVAGSVLYFFGYLATGYDVFVSVLRAIFSAARMFFLNDDYSLIEKEMANSRIMSSFWFLKLFWAIHVAAFISTAFTVVSLFGHKLIEKVMIFAKRGKKICVIVGSNSSSLCLASSLMVSKDKLVIVIDENVDKTASDRIRNLGAILIEDRLFNNGSIETRLLKKIGLFRESLDKEIVFFLFDNDETYNISVAKSLIDVAKINKVGSNKLKIYVQSNDKMVQRDIKEIFGDEPYYEINTICEAELAARQLFEDYPIYSTLKIDTTTASVNDEAFTILIVGFGKIGREVLLKSLCNGQFVNINKEQVPFNAIVFDHQWVNKSWKFKNIHPHLQDKFKGIKFENYSSDREEFYCYLKENINNINYIVIATENDYGNLELAKSIQAFVVNHNISWGKKVMAVHMRNQSKLLNHINENTIFKHMKFFGEYENIFNEKIIIDEKMDTLAKKIQEHYNYQNEQRSAKTGTYDDWRYISLFDKNSNRETAAHLSTKLALIGYEKTDSKDDSDMNGNDLLDKYINYNQLENLLRVEHLRWNAFYFVNGWIDFNKGEIKQLKMEHGGKVPHGFRKDSNKRKHCCLVSWEELLDLSNDFIYGGKCDKSLMEKYPYIKGFQLEDLKQTLYIPKFLDFATIGAKKIR